MNKLSAMGIDQLVPFAINIKNENDDEIRLLCNLICMGTKAIYFRDQETLLEVINDVKHAIRNAPRLSALSFSPGPYLLVHQKNSEELRLTSSQTASPDYLTRGATVLSTQQAKALMTIYAVDQAASEVEQERYGNTPALDHHDRHERRSMTPRI